MLWLTSFFLTRTFKTPAPVVEAVKETVAADLAPAAEEPAAATTTETAAATTSEDAKKKEKIGRRLSTRITGLFTPKPKDSKFVPISHPRSSSANQLFIL